MEGDDKGPLNPDIQISKARDHPCLEHSWDEMATEEQMPLKGDPEQVETDALLAGRSAERVSLSGKQERDSESRDLSERQGTAVSAKIQSSSAHRKDKRFKNLDQIVIQQLIHIGEKRNNIKLKYLMINSYGSSNISC
ncbi:UNVERIFIED_CONTAM: hypothetical protein K2H54_059368 [Gekko kuhli]